MVYNCRRKKCNKQLTSWEMRNYCHACGKKQKFDIMDIMFQDGIDGGHIIPYSIENDWHSFRGGDW